MEVMCLFLHFFLVQITLVPPTGKLWYLGFQIVRALLLSMQGSVITVPYCFLNTEVRATLRNSYHRWKLNRNINGGGAGGGAGLGGSGAAGAGTCMSESRWGK